METTTNTLVESGVANAKKAKQMIVGKFNGHFAPVGLGLYNILIGSGINKQLATKIGMDYMSDWARNYDSTAEAKSKVGKFNDNREAKMTAAGMKTAKAAGTSSMFVARYAQTVDGLKDEGVVTKRVLDFKLLPDFVQEYLEESEKWIATQTWETAQ